MKMWFGPVHVLGAVARNTTDSPAWDVINVYGSFEKSFISSFVKSICCMMYENQGNINFIHQKASHTQFLATKPNVRTFRMVCPNTQYSVGIVPIAVHLSQEGLGCDKNRDRYVKVEFPFLEPGFKIAIGTQIAYKNISAELIIEWMETYKFLHVDKVVSYYHRSINQDALNALKYYHHTGFVDLYELDLPLEGKIH